MRVKVITVKNVPAHGPQQRVAAVALLAAETVQDDIHTIRIDSDEQMTSLKFLPHIEQVSN